jgi:hypothetical protein
MSEKLESWSERYGPEGSAAGQGVLRTLGTPPLERLELFTREVIQNCWDAATDRKLGRVDVTMKCDLIDSKRQRFVKDQLLPDSPDVLGLERALEDSPRLLTISDRGTHGLAGPTRADLITKGPTDFVDFLRNVGQPPDKPMGGGSFGFGKAALYLASLAHTIVVHSRAVNEHGDLESRLIAAGLSHPVVEGTGSDARGLTGRHMWGKLAQSGDFAEPVRDGECLPFLEGLGLSPFDSGETGTDITIVAPSLSVGEQTPQEVDPRLGMDLIARSVAWHFWPKIYGPDPKMRISLFLDDREVSIPSPEDEPRLAAFQSALFRLEGQETPAGALKHETYGIECLNPRKFLGNLAIETHPVTNGDSPATEIAAPESGQPLCHVALVRNAELVVKYLKGPELPASGAGYAGIFRVAKDDEELDQIFRDSEPPSHDDWVPQALGDRAARTWVNMAQKRVREMMDSYVGAEAPTGLSVEDVPLGAISKQLSSLIPSTRGDGAEPKPGKSSSSGRRSAPILVERPAHPVLRDDVLAFEASVKALRDVEIEALPAVAVLDGGKPEGQPPDGAAVPEVIGWEGPNGQVSTESSVNVKSGERWKVIVSSPGDSMILVDFEANE